jgi:DHA2 family multidrug resistance protein
LTRNTQIMHASLAAHVTPYGQVWHGQLLPTLPKLAELNAMVTRQAAMVAYIDDFKVMMVLSAAAIPLVLLLRIGSRTGSPVVAAE